MPKEINDLEKYFRNNEDRLIHKWNHYFDIYDRHFSRFRNKEIVILEIGLSHGGSLQMWKNYFGKDAKIYGIDIEPKCKDLEEENIEIFIVGGPEDSLLADSLLEAWGVNKIQNYCGKLTISESAELIRKCNIYIGNDTGIMHLAAMVGTVCLTIFSSRDYPGLWEPFGDNHVSIRKNIDCEGCMLVECNKLNNACLKLTSVDEVFSEVTKILSSNGFK